MLKLSDIAAATAQADCTILGKTFPVRAISAMDYTRIIEAVPEPSPPMIYEVGKPGRVNEKSPQFAEYRKRAEERERVIVGANLAASISLAKGVDLGVEPFESIADAALPAWCVAANDVLRRSFSFSQLNTIIDACHSASRGVFARAAAELWTAVPPGHVDPPGFDTPPKDHIESEVMLELRVCERLHISPRDIDSFQPGELAVFIQFDRLRRMEAAESLSLGV